MWSKAALPLAVLLASPLGCSAGGSADFSADGPSLYPGQYGGTSTTSGAPDSSGTSPPPEAEQNFLLLPPAQTDIYVFITNPDRNTVTRVNVRTLAVDTTPVGTDPQIVQTTPDYTTAVVFNRGDDSVTLLDADSLDQQTVDVRANFNDLVLSPDGAWAVLFHNQARERPDDPLVDGLQSFNEISLVRIATGEHFPMAVGFNPRMVRFTPDGARAVVVADAYLATIDLTVSEPSPDLIELSPGELNPPTAEEVIVARDGSFAWVRQFGATELLVVDLVTGGVLSVPAGTNPTDLDLSADGTEAIAVARGSQELWVYDAAAPVLVPSVLPLPAAAAYGSLLVDPSGDQGVLYTTAAAVERYAVWERGTDSFVERSVVKPISGVAVDPTGDTLLVFHTQTDGPLTDPLFEGEWALTLIDMEDQRSNPLRLPGEPTGYANGTDGTWGFFIMEDQPFLEVLDYETLLHEQFSLRSLPEFVGVLPELDPSDGDAPPAWVSQEHELGRISFFDPDDASLETLTGFELNSEIE